MLADMAKTRGSLTGAQMREARERLQLTSTDVAARLGVSERTLTRWEASAYVPETAAKLFRILYEVVTDGEHQQPSDERPAGE